MDGDRTRTQSVLIAQITDTHIGYDPDGGLNEENYLRFVSVLDHIRAQPHKPDLLVLSGDLADRGDTASYALLKQALAQCPFPAYPMAGNHDQRTGLLGAFPEFKDANGFAQYAIECDGLRVLCLDTLEHGRHGGAFCETRAAWLAQQLDTYPDTPTLIFMHHPPVVTGIEWMDPKPHEAWFQRFHATVARHNQIVGIKCGHLHRPLHATVARIPLSVAPAVAPAVALDLRPIDIHHPDNRVIVNAEPPYYSLHRWHDGQLVTHFQPVGKWQALARYDERLEPMMQSLFAERN